MEVLTNDTALITQLYLQRPQALQKLSLGQWFIEAHGLSDRQLELCVSGLETKLLLVSKGYVHLPLDPLVAFNKLPSAGRKG